MAATLTDIFRVLKSIRDEMGPSETTVVLGRQASVSVPDHSTVLANILTELQAQSTTLSSLDADSTTIIGHVDGLEALLTTIDTSLDAIEADADAIRITNAAIDVTNAAMDTSLNAIESDADAIRITNAAMDTSLNNIESDADASRLSLIDIENNTDGIEGKQDAALSELQSIDANWNLLSVNSIAQLAINALLINIENEIDNVEELLQSQFQFKLDRKFDVTSIAGGTEVRISIQVAANNPLLHMVLYSETDSGSIRTRYIITDGTGTASNTNRQLNDETLSNGAEVVWPTRDAVDQSMESPYIVIKNPDTLHVRYTGVAVGDTILLAIRAKMEQSSSAPTVNSTTLTTATVTETDIRNEIDET